jgi:hypothetical protein
LEAEISKSGAKDAADKHPLRGRKRHQKYAREFDERDALAAASANGRALSAQKGFEESARVQKCADYRDGRSQSKGFKRKTTTREGKINRLRAAGRRVWHSNRYHGGLWGLTSHK